MPDITIVRVSYLQRGTVGQILDATGLVICGSLERPWLDNRVDVSCIPTGLYTMKIDTRRPGTDKECLVWELLDVPGRSQVQFHIANRVSQLKGCVAPVTNFSDLGGDLFGSSSGNAFKKFMKNLNGKEDSILTCMVTDGVYLEGYDQRPVSL
uniref:DUF5675 domain-containing protein n=1 Tax=uncultured marine virus TaxID=186617 RepID=A0A0F7L7H5_9VIRU|nr:hypothetical protein Desal_1848 [uncultured marine virus]